MTDAVEERQLLDVQGLDVFYGSSQVVFGVDLAVEPGEIVTLLGRNGSGKTSTLMGIAGAVSSKAATLRVGSVDLSALPVHSRVRAGLVIVPSGSRGFANLTVNENLLVVAAPPSRNGHSRIDDLYDSFPALAALRDSSAGTLSGGERQMLAVARALLMEPRLLMLDEPSEGLSPLVIRDLGEMLRKLAASGRGLLIAEQNHRFALDLADRALFMEKGQVAWLGTAEEAMNPDILHRFLAL